MFIQTFTIEYVHLFQGEQSKYPQLMYHISPH